MSKKSIIATLIVLVLIIIGGWFYFSNYQIPSFNPGQSEEIVPEQEEEIPSVHIPSDRAEKYYISSRGSEPDFVKEVIIDPFFNVQESEEQYLSIWAKDPAGIAEVTATVKLAEGDRLIQLQLAEGTKEEGKWEGTWIIENVSSNPKCRTDYWAVNDNGEETVMPVSSWYPISNQSPEIVQFQGPSQGSAGEILTFSVKAVDPENDNVSVFVRVRWYEDGQLHQYYSEWSEYQPSNTLFQKEYQLAAGSYTVQIQAKDSEGAESDWSSSIIVTVTAAPPAPVIPPNQPPEIVQFQGPSQGLAGEILTFSVKVSDSENDLICVRFGWEEGYSEWSEYYPSGSVFEVSYAWSIAKSYSIQGQARDSFGNESTWCQPITVTITERSNSNQPPEIVQFQGPAEGLEGEELTFQTTAVDPEDGTVTVRFKKDYIRPFDSKPISEIYPWQAYLPSGSVFEMVFCSNMPMVYHISTQAKDSSGMESDWSQPITVTIGEVIPPANLPPEISRFSGPSDGLVDETLFFSARIRDRENDQICVRSGWDNGQDSEILTDWSEYKPSGSIFDVPHSWASPGIFIVQVQAKDFLGNLGEWSEPISVVISDNIVGVDSEVPRVFALFQNYPNPFNPITEIAFGLPEDSHVTLAVFNSLGQQIAVLVDESRGAGQHQVSWDGAGFTNGVYFYRLSAKGFAETRKMLLLK